MGRPDQEFRATEKIENSYSKFLRAHETDFTSI